MRFAYFRLAGPVLVLFAVVLAATCVLPFYAADRIDAESIRREEMLVRRNIVLWTNELENEIQRYVTWDEAMNYVGIASNMNWARRNIVGAIFARTSHRFAAVLDGNNELMFSEIRQFDGADGLFRRHSSEILAEGVRLTRSARIFESSRREGHDPTNLSESRILMLDGTAVLVTASLFQNQTRRRMPDGFRAPVLVTALPIEGGLVETFSNRLLLANALLEWRLSESEAESEKKGVASARVAEDGSASLLLTWTPFRPGKAMLERALPLMAVSILAFLAGAAFLFNLSRRATDALMRSEAQLRHAASHDVLTGLRNRRTFETTLDAMARQGPLTLVCLDLDGFKPVNDRFGHAAGDAVLREIAGRLERARRPEDAAFRLGGDEFALLMPGLVGAEARAVCRTLSRLLAAPIQIVEGKVAVGASMGLATVDGEPSLRTALARADAALYRTKARRKAGEAPAGAEDGVEAAA